MPVFSAEVEKRIEELETQIAIHERAVLQLNREIEILKCVDSPIQPGDFIEWTHRVVRSSNEERKEFRRGYVISMSHSNSYREESYKYRCNITNAKGIAVGFASVCEEQSPQLLKKGRATKPKAKKK